MSTKKFINLNVYKASIERFNFIFDNFKPSEISLSFSGGKDSTVCLRLLEEIIIKRNIKEKINILFIDLEAHYKKHIEFSLEALDKNKFNIYWISLPLTLTNASSSFQPKWICWEEKLKNKWIRQPPDIAITDINYFDFYKENMEFEEFIKFFPIWLAKKNNVKNIINIIGIRADESLRRYVKVKKSQKGTEYYKNKNFIMIPKYLKNNICNIYNFHPIYDWSVKDIWKYTYLTKKKYNPIYDLMYWYGVNINLMRICQPYGEEQRNNIDLWHIIEYKTWEKLLKRVEGVNFANIYVKDLINKPINKPKNFTWEQYLNFLLNTIPKFLKEHYINKFNKFIEWYKNKNWITIDEPRNKEELELEKNKKISTYKRMCKVILKGDYFCKSLSFSCTKNEYDKLLKLKEKWEKEL